MSGQAPPKSHPDSDKEQLHERLISGANRDISDTTIKVEEMIDFDLLATVLRVMAIVAVVLVVAYLYVSVGAEE